MKKLVLVTLLYASSLQAQIIVEQRVYEVPRIQNIVVNPFPPSHWDRKRAPEIQRPLQVISVPQQVIIPTVPNTQPLPGQTAEEQRQMQNLIR
jgi:hypothetical protein